MSVVIPTIGRPRLLEQCLRSILANEPGPAEVVVGDQSGDVHIAALIRDLGDARLVRAACDGTGASRARNAALGAASHDVVMLTDDDCRVGREWVATGWAHLASRSDTIVTGRVLPGSNDMAPVPSTTTDEAVRDWTGIPNRGVLSTGNMAARRSELLGLGGFDERPSLRRAAEDNDLCFRWIAAGNRLEYHPDLVVWHEDWRPPAEVRAVHARYARGQGAFYAKHLVRGDRTVGRFLLEDLRHSCRARIAALRRRTRRSDSVTAAIPWMLVGVAHGLLDAARRRRQP